MWCQEKGRSIELIIVVTVYNEDNLELEATLRGLAANVEVSVMSCCFVLFHVASELHADAWLN